MNYFSAKVNGRELRLSAYSKNVIRIRVSDDFNDTLFERYGIYNPVKMLVEMRIPV